MANINESCFLDVMRYPSHLLKVNDGNVQIPATYKRIWDDGFGARGWKIDAAIGDPVIIASTRETGERINTSVFIHDILDHFLSGFGVSGHRCEAMALMQLAKRTGSTPQPDYEQMIREDIMGGVVNGEAVETFLPTELNSMLPSNTKLTNREIMTYLQEKIGEKYLMDALIDHFFVIGKAGETHADSSWKKLGIDVTKRTGIGLALQSLLGKVDTMAEKTGMETLKVIITINNKKCSMNLLDFPVSSHEYSARVC